MPCFPQVAAWRYTEWRKWDGAKLAADWSSTGLVALELYDHAGGWPADAPGAFDYEQVNLAVTDRAAHAATILGLAEELQAYFAAKTLVA